MSNKALDGVLQLYSIYNHHYYHKYIDLECMIEYLLGVKITKIQEILANEAIKKIVKFDWPTNDSGNLKNEKDATPYIIEYIQLVMNLFDDNLFKIQNISANTDIQLEIPFIENKKYYGRPDAIIVPRYTGRLSLKSHTRVLFEFKTNKSIKLQSTQYYLELLAASLEACKPVLLVQTDLKTFRFIMLRNQYIREVILEEKEENSNLAFQFISHWLDYSEKEDFSEWNKSLQKYKLIANEIKGCQNNKHIQGENYRDNYSKEFTTLTQDDIEYCQKNKFLLNISTIEEAYFKKHVKLSIEGRSGRTYQIIIDGNKYALKLYCDDKINNAILDEMKNEKEIYQSLGKSDYWPDLAYAGPLFDRAYYGICTSFIDGKCYSSTKTAFSQKIKENCIKALKELHAKDVIHKDIRSSNFIIKENSAVIIDFGFSTYSSDPQKKATEIELLTSSFK